VKEAKPTVSKGEKKGEHHYRDHGHEHKSESILKSPGADYTYVIFGKPNMDNDSGIGRSNLGGL
jgi:hypothetical protein